MKVKLRVGEYAAEFWPEGHPVWIDLDIKDTEGLRQITLTHRQVRDLHQLLGLVRERVQPLLQPTDRHEG
jgi:hypothetical protein